MTFKHLYRGAFSAVALSALSGTVQAAPLSGSASALESGTIPSPSRKPRTAAAGGGMGTGYAAG